MLGGSNLESIDRTVPREAPENAMLDKVDLKMVKLITLSQTYLFLGFEPFLWWSPSIYDHIQSWEEETNKMILNFRSMFPHLKSNQTRYLER